MKLNKETFDRWNGWCNKISYDLIQNLFFPQQMWKLLNEKKLYRYTAALDVNLFRHFMAKCYFSQAAMTIRRHSKSSQGESTVLRLLEQLRDSHCQYTFEKFERLRSDEKARCEGSTQWHIEVFRTISDDGITISKAIIDKDIDNLTTKSNRIVQICDTEIAHLDYHATRNVEVTYQELDDLIAELDTTYCKYLHFVASNANRYTSLAIHNLDESWLRIFQDRITETP